MPRNGCLTNFGVYEFYVATEFVRGYPEKVLVAADPPAVCAARGRLNSSPVSRAEVMMTAKAGADAVKAGAGKGVASAADAPSKSARLSKPPLEKDVGASAAAAKACPLQAAIEKLTVPVASTAVPALTAAELEERCLHILREAEEVARAKQVLNISQREYDRAHGFTTTLRK